MAASRPVVILMPDTSTTGSHKHLARRAYMMHLLTGPIMQGGLALSVNDVLRHTARAIQAVCEKLYCQDNPGKRVNPAVLGQEFFTLLAWQHLFDVVSKSETRPSPVLAPRSNQFLSLPAVPLER